MLRRIITSSSPVLCSIFPFQFSSEDVVSKDSKTAKAILEGPSRKETGRDRLHYMFSTDEFGNLSPELNSVFQVGFFGSLIGVMYGGVTHSRIAYMNFLENNQATRFKSHLDAKKMLQDQVTISFGKGAFKWGWRLGLFSISYTLITTSVSVYRGKSSIIEYLFGGSITGALYKFTLGPRAMLVGGGLGTCLGAVAGCISLALLKLSGISMEEVRYWQYQFHVERREQVRKIIQDHKEKEDMDLVKEYRQKRTDMKHTLEYIDTVEK